MDHPNVLLICVEHWPGSFLGCDGHPVLMTPTLDELAASGVRFTRAYSATPTCIPARRALMTGTTSKTHGDRVFNETLPMPDMPTLAQCFRDAGYQAYAVGKLHVYPQRDRIGFDDVVLNEEGRHHLGLGADDYELFLAAEGYAGQEFAHGMCTNDYVARPWHLPEYVHPTNWTVREMCRTIKRRDPTRPAFWYMSFHTAHPPLTPLNVYMDMYRHIEIDQPYIGRWAQNEEDLPYAIRFQRTQWSKFNDAQIRLARQAFYARCTHVDHQIRLVVGMLSEEGLLDNTIIMFVGDHGDMLGNHGLCIKSVFYENSTRIPLFLVPTAAYERVGHHQVDDRIAELRDVMPTLLDLAGIPIPGTVEGLSLLSDTRREYLYGEHYEDDQATRMIFDGRYKLIYYPVGNRKQLFDLENDPCELVDLAGRSDLAEVKTTLTSRLIENLYDSDRQWITGDRLTGLPDKEYHPPSIRDLYGQRGWRFM